MVNKKKGTPKKTAPVLPPFFDYSTFVPPVWAPLTTSPDVLSTQAAASRTVIQSAWANPSVLLRIRQVDWEDFHDVFVLVEKKWSVLRLQGTIAQCVHRRAVDTADVMVFLPATDSESGPSGLSSSISAPSPSAGTDADKAEPQRVVVGDGTGEDGNEGAKPDAEEQRKTPDAAGDGEDAGAAGGDGKEGNSGSATKTTTDPPNGSSGSKIQKPRRTADPFSTLDMCFPDINTRTAQSSSASAPPHAAFEFLPPGRVVPAYELHSLLTEIARAQQLAAAAQAKREREAQAARDQSNALGPPTRRMAISGQTRRSSFMLRRGSIGGFMDAAIPLPPVQLPPAVEIWYDVALPAMIATNIKQPGEKPPELLTDESTTSLLARHHAPHISSNPIIMYEGYRHRKSRLVDGRLSMSKEQPKPGGMVGSAAPLPGQTAPPPPAPVVAPPPTPMATGRKRAQTMTVPKLAAMSSFAEGGDGE